MGRKIKRLAGPAQLANSAATIYTAPSPGRATITRIYLMNPDTGSGYNVTVSIGADAAGTRILDAKPIAAQAAGSDDNIIDLPGPFTLATGETIQAWADTAAKVVLVIDGVEDTI